MHSDLNPVVGLTFLGALGLRQREKRKVDRLASELALQERDPVGDALVDLTLTPNSLPDLSVLPNFCLLNGPLLTRICQLSRSSIYWLQAVFEAAAYQSYHGNPRADHLLTLAKLNVFRAFLHNIAALGYSREWMSDDALSRFSISGPHPMAVPLSNIPSSLHPTELQQSQPHHPWLDSFPFARLRDNLIQNEDSMDDFQFCRDLMGFWTMPSEENCMLVWGNPWDPMNWEVTEVFLRKWGWLIKGCPEILWSTNYWRLQRGEKRLAWRACFDRIQ